MPATARSCELNLGQQPVAGHFLTITQFHPGRDNQTAIHFDGIT